ncbi:PIG-L family deacetylase [Candidatus Aerophobetes bacterium]|nr:PIG-L family deacetylase [Candidatus Aerophobetes bacterium]
MRILAIGAHPDDIELLCAGTLAKFKKRGDKIFMAYLCNGNKGHFEISAPVLAQMRKEEAKNSAKLLEAESLGPVAPDLELYRDKPTMDKVIDIIRKVAPDLIITHSPFDYMCDHTVTSQIVCDASFMATLPNYKTDYPAHTRITPIYFMDTMTGINFQPTEYVDITEFIEIKTKMLLCHISQAKWLKEHDGIDYVEFMKKIASYRGLQCGVPFAEGFQAYPVWGRIKPERLLP